MPSFIALLRAVNVGGTSKLPMTHLKTMCEDAGFESVRTYIASGNVIFETAANGTARSMTQSLSSRRSPEAFAAHAYFLYLKTHRL
ncbi:MAG TPA: DUF1697 domain-containing protein [Gemmatimonadaceae bacterium]